MAGRAENSAETVIVGSNETVDLARAEISN
jgi:hypothetical protein